ncbi:hypothetical protein CR513_46301, partial [Mucuna pruriens]
MEICMKKVKTKESQEATMARFLHGLNKEIQDIVELHNYGSLKDLVHHVTKLSSRKSYPNANWKGKKKEKERPRRDKSPKKGNDISQGQKDMTLPSTSSSFKSSNIKCFKYLGNGHIVSQYPNKRTMVLRKNGEVDSE